MKQGIVLALLLMFSLPSYSKMMVCNRLGCEDVYSYDSQEVMDALAQMFAGGKKELLFCAADSAQKKCYTRPISFWGRTNLVSVEFQIPFARIYEVQLEEDAVRLILDYQVQTNKYYPSCSPSDAALVFSASNRGDFVLSSSDFNCRITELGETKMRVQFTLDYLNLEKGLLGGSYQVSVQGDVLGGGTGYALLQFSEKRHVELPRRVPSDGTTSDENSSAYAETPADIMPQDVTNEDTEAAEESVADIGEAAVPAESVRKMETYHSEPGEEPKLVDWDMDNIAEKWDNFKTKFLKILYLEPTDD